MVADSWKVSINHYKEVGFRVSSKNLFPLGGGLPIEIILFAGSVSAAAYL
jgi:hypothetical protein